MNAAAAVLAAQMQQLRIDALQRRAQQRGGATRDVSEQQLRRLRAGSTAAAAPGEADAAAAAAAADRVSPLAALLASLARQTAPAGELKAVRDYRGTWVRLGVQQRLTQTLARVPDNAGPLNTQRLMHEALTLMGELSPAYLQHFMAHVEALLALDELGHQAAPPPRKDGPRTPRKG